MTHTRTRRWSLTFFLTCPLLGVAGIVAMFVVAPRLYTRGSTTEERDEKEGG